MSLWTQAILIAFMALPIAYALDRYRELRREQDRRIITFLEELEDWEDDDGEA
jgi:hypothetical protein